MKIMQWTLVAAAMAGNVMAAEFVPPAAGEHPRLFFRKSDLAEIKKRAETPEGKLIVARLRYLLNAGDGASLPATPAGLVGEAPVGKAWTLWHAAGYGMLYQLTGDQKYADLGKQSTEMALSGKIDRDTRYSFRMGKGALRLGPAVGAVAMGYDLCYDGWDEAFRTKVATAIQNVNNGPGHNLPDLARGSAHNPNSNHWGPQIGGAAMAILAILNDPGTDTAKMTGLLETSKKSYQKQLTSGLGTRGYYWEQPGPGQTATDTAFTPGLLAWKNAAGVDWSKLQPEAQWVTMRWVLWLTANDEGPCYPNPVRFSSYGGQNFTRDGLSKGGQFVQGFGTLSPEQKAAALWTYKTFVEPFEVKEYAKLGGLKPGDRSFDMISAYPHRAIMALVSWPIGVEPVNPGKVLPKSVVDERMQWYVFRNRWQDDHDVLIATLLGARPDAGHWRLRLWGMGQRFHAEISPSIVGGKLTEAGKDAWTLAWQGAGLTVDFTGKAGADAVAVVTGLPVKQDPPEVTGPKVDKIDLTGTWVAGRNRIALKQTGGEITAVGTIPWKKFSAILTGNDLVTDFGGPPMNGTVSDDGNTIEFTNDTTWQRQDSAAAKIPDYAYKAGDKAKLTVVGAASVLTFSETGKHPEVKLDGDKLTVGTRTYTLTGGAFAPQ